MNWFDTLCEGMGLNKERRQFLLRALWVIAVSGHIAWICGFLAWIGLSVPFVNAGDLQKVTAVQDAKLNELIASQRRSDDLLKKALLQSKATEIRAALLKVCTSRPADREAVLREKDRLQDEYLELAGRNYPEPPCEQLR